MFQFNDNASVTYYGRRVTTYGAVTVAMACLGQDSRTDTNPLQVDFNSARA